jgi:hypothetical protein
LGRMGLGRMARWILRLAPLRRRLPGRLLRRRLCGSNWGPCADQRIFRRALRPAAARGGLSRQGIYARWRRGVHRPLHPGKCGCNSRASARGRTPGRSATSTLKRLDAYVTSRSLAHHSRENSPAARSLPPGLFSTTPAMMTAPMGTTAGEGGLAERTEAAPVFCEACLGLRHVRDRVATEPESIVRAGLAGCLGRCRANIRGHRAGQQSEHRDCRESNTSGFNISHLAQSSYGPSVTLARERGPL